MQNSPNDKMIKCPVCGKEFATQEEHDKHHAEAHPDDKPM